MRVNIYDGFIVGFPFGSRRGTHAWIKGFAVIMSSLIPQ